MKYIFEEEKQGWYISEDTFNNSQLGKCESIFYLGNGYMGIRSATEERYLQERRGMFVSGTFNKFDEKEVTELPNMPDIIQMDIFLDKERLDLSKMKFEGYNRTINMKEGELTRTFTVTTAQSKKISFQFRRVVSLKNHHIAAQEMRVISDSPVKLDIKSGIEGKVTNSGFQHLSVVNKRIFDGKMLQGNYKTTQTKIGVSINTAHTVLEDGKEVTPDISQELEMDSRSIYMNFHMELEAGKEICLEKVSAVYTDRDLEVADSGQELTLYARVDLEKEVRKGYQKIAQESAAVWMNEIWSRQDVEIVSENYMDQLAIHFAVFHMIMMTPGYDNRVNIGAKALSGEGYKGHTFWDTEMFLLPFWIYTCPKTARSLLEYRYLGLGGARKKAKDNGYEGAMYPWESAWITDGEVTPRFGAADVVTGKEMPIICGDLEQHITSDVSFGVWEYYQITQDEEFMEKYGYEIIFDTATFWASRVSWNPEKSQYEILDVIGPDEYSEHADNNAYTNYMAHWNMKLAIQYYWKLRTEKNPCLEKLNRRLDLEEKHTKWEQVAEKIYLPQVNKDLLLPQDDMYLSYPIIDLKKYKASATRADIIKDYNMDQIAHMQVSKQADVVLLLYLMENLFPKEVKEANFYYYEDKCLHDSSLSLSSHAILASDLKEEAMAYEFFQRAATIDLGPDMNTPSDGIHAASMGGIWQCVINGFAGVRMIDGNLRVNPYLPAGWHSLRFILNWKGVELQFIIDREKMKIAPKERGKEIEVECYGKFYHVSEETEIVYA